MLALLYVSDDLSLEPLLKCRLEQDGKIRVDTVSSAEAALEMLRQARYDLVVSGHALPDIDSIALLQQIRMQSPEMPFILFSRNGGEKVIIGAYDGGADFCIRVGTDIPAALDELAGKAGQAITGRQPGEFASDDESIFRSLINWIRNPVLILSPDGEVLFTNPAARTIAGLQESEAAENLNISAVLDQATLKKVLKKLQEPPGGPSPSLEEYPVITRQGETRWVEAAATRILFRRKDAVLVTLHDRTSRRVHEQEMYRMQVFLQGVIDAIPDPVFVKDRQHRWVIMNDAACTVVGRTREELLGKTDMDFFPKEEAQVFFGRDDAIFTTGTDDENEQFLTDAEENRHVVLTKKRRITGPAGELYILGVSRDITEWRQMETALRQSEERYRSLFDHLIGATALFEILSDEHGEAVDYRVIEINNSFEQMFGVTRGDLIGRRYEDIFGPKVPPVLNGLAHVDRNGISEVVETYFAPAKKHLLVSTYSPSKGLVATVIMDITLRKKAEDALHQANVKLNLMSRITRHDILNQVQVLRALIAISRDYLREPQKMLACIGKEEQAVLQIQHQITFTRDYQDLGLHEPVWQPVRGIVNTIIDSLPMGTVRVEVACADREIFADRLLERVFYNLFENALRHGGMRLDMIRIFSVDSSAGMTIVIEDNGEGIPNEEKKYLFEHGTATQPGLGLFLSREILSISGIRISENGIPGKGARFEILVPPGGYRDREEKKSVNNPSRGIAAPGDRADLHQEYPV